jgi:hypothetical protein
MQASHGCPAFSHEQAANTAGSHSNALCYMQEAYSGQIPPRP